MTVLSLRAHSAEAGGKLQSFQSTGGLLLGHWTGGQLLTIRSPVLLPVASSTDSMAEFDGVITWDRGIPTAPLGRAFRITEGTPAKEDHRGGSNGYSLRVTSTMAF